MYIVDKLYNIILYTFTMYIVSLICYTMYIVKINKVLFHGSNENGKSVAVRTVQDTIFILSENGRYSKQEAGMAIISTAPVKIRCKTVSARDGE